MLVIFARGTYVFLYICITIIILSNTYVQIYHCFFLPVFKYFGSGSSSGSGWIRIIWPDPDPLKETLIWIRVVKKNRDKLVYK